MDDMISFISHLERITRSSESQRDCVMLLVIEYFAKSLKVI